MMQLPEGLDLSNIREHRGKFQVRVHPYPYRTFPGDQQGLLAALSYRDKLIALRASGIRDLPVIEPDGVTIEELARGYRESELKRMRVEGLSGASITRLTSTLRPWTGELEQLDGLGRPLHLRTAAGLQAGDVSDWVLGRAIDVPTSARDELARLRSLLHYGEDRGVEIDRRIFRVRAPKVTTRVGIALSYPELEFVASFAFDYIYRSFLVIGTVGLRIMEALQAVDEWFDAEAMTLTVPAWACKERREKVIQLTVEERDLIAEQQAQRVLRLGQPRYIFCRRAGTPFKTQAAFYGSVFADTLRRAIDRHVTEHGEEPRWGRWQRDEHGEILRTKDSTQKGRNGNRVMKRGLRRYEGLEIHDLRRTAISLMREAGMPEEYVAARVGHIDDGALAMKTYRKVRADEQRRFLRELGAGIGSTLTAAHAADAEAAR